MPVLALVLRSWFIFFDLPQLLSLHILPQLLVLLLWLLLLTLLLLLLLLLLLTLLFLLLLVVLFAMALPLRHLRVRRRRLLIVRLLIVKSEGIQAVQRATLRTTASLWYVSYSYFTTKMIKSDAPCLLGAAVCVGAAAAVHTNYSQTQEITHQVI